VRVALLSGGTGGAKLARGLLDEVGGESLTVIANTGDDAWAHGAHVSPDPDLVTYWLADAITVRFAAPISSSRPRASLAPPVPPESSATRIGVTRARSADRSA